MTQAFAAPSLRLRRRVPPVLWRALVIVALIGVWQAGSSLDLINPFTAPPPSEILRGFGKLWTNGEIAPALLLTAAESFAAAALGSLFGVAIGYWLHVSPRVGRAYTAWVAAAASAPLVLMYPLFLVMFGRNAGTIIAMGAVGCTPPIALKAKEGLDGVRKTLLDVGRTFNLSRRQIFRMILFPAALPTIFAGIRIGLLFAIINVVGTEFLISLGGLGQLISNLGDRFDYPAMYAGIFFVMLVSVAFFYLTEKLERWLLSSH